ncbi:MAG: hypothetical protein K0Q53_848 [Massilibacillus sp.]|jgi:hypothetical protein|nr:hypothetical protein [Massilibacillus sp.]
MIEKVEKTAKMTSIETWHRFNRRTQLKCSLKSPFRRILDKKIRQLRKCKESVK